MGRLAADADAACASLILAARATLKASVSATSAAAEHSRHFLEASGLRAWVLVKLAAGRSCLQTLQESGSPLPSAPLLPPLLLLDALLFVAWGSGKRRCEMARARWFHGGSVGDQARRNEAVLPACQRKDARKPLEASEAQSTAGRQAG